MPEEPCPYVSRGGLKLAAAIDAFGLDVSGFVCADFGCNVGGFTDCLLGRGAARVYAIDTGYGELAWTVRNDRRVVVLERTNALHLDPTAIDGFFGCDLVTIDLGWTRQSHAVPAALRWLRDDEAARIVTLIKPHYEAQDAEQLRGRKGILAEADAERVLHQTLGAMPALGVRVLAHIRSPLRGGAGKGRTGNVEYLALLAR